MALVDVHHVGDADVGDAGEMLVVILAAAARGPGGMALVVASDADDRDVDRVVRAPLCARTRRQRSASPAVAAAVLEKKTRRFIMAGTPVRSPGRVIVARGQRAEEVVAFGG